MPLLIDYFGPEHINELAKPDRRTYFEMTLFAALRLPKALREFPNCARHLNNFFESSLVYYEDRVATATEKTSSVDATAFLCTQWQRALVYIQKEGITEIDGKPVADVMVQVRKKIKTLQKDPDFQKPEIQQQLHLAMLDSYHADPADPETLTRDIVESVVSYEKSIQCDGSCQLFSPAFANGALATPIKRSQLMKESSIKILSSHEVFLTMLQRNMILLFPKISYGKNRLFLYIHAQFLEPD